MFLSSNRELTLASAVKNHNAATGVEDNSYPASSPQVKNIESQSDKGFSDAGSASSARDTLPSPCTIQFTKQENEGEMNRLPNCTDPPSTNTGDAHQGRGDMNLETEDQRVDEAVNLHKAATHPSHSGRHTVASEEDLIDPTQRQGHNDGLKSPVSLHACEGDYFISSSDEAHSVVTPNRQMGTSRRTFKPSCNEAMLKSRCVASSSTSHMKSRFNEEVGRKGLSFESEEFQSVENWMAVQKDGDLQDKVDLLWKTDQVRGHLAKIYIAGKEGDMNPHRGLQQKNKLPVRHFPEHGSCACVQCQEKQRPPHLHGHGSYGVKSQNVDSHASSSGSLRKFNLDNKPKNHCRATSGAAPFVICYECNKLLQLPVDFLVSRRREHKLQCGRCSEVLVLPFPAKSGNVTEVMDDPQEAHVYGPEQALHSPSADHGGRGTRRATDGPRLHRLMADAV